MQPTEPTDAELVAQTLAGNREAFGSLYDRYARLVRSVICGDLRDEILPAERLRELERK